MLKFHKNHANDSPLNRQNSELGWFRGGLYSHISAPINMTLTLGADQ